jgi:hypothetical protein
MPVTAIKPISVVMVARRIGVFSRSAWVNKAAMSAGEYRYGTARRGPPGNRPAGGISVAGSRVRR